MCGVVDRDAVEQLFADLFAAVLDGQDRRTTHQLRQAADHAAAAVVQVVVEAHQAAGAVPVQAQQGFQSGDQRPPLVALRGRAVREGCGGDDAEPAGDLAAAHTGEQALHFDIDAGIDKGGRQPFGEVLQLIGHLRTGAGGQVEVVQLVDKNQLDTGVSGGCADHVHDVGDVRSAGELQAEEAGELHRQHPCRRSRWHGDVEDRQPVPISGITLAGAPFMGAAQLG